ncbi:TIGR01906 family membrane protein [Thermohalobacter berrensis]|uniref:TIGR01906 family membrane protein n=1 Tax=Thermohalobacter berrensis TaxID=99594 RepID=A0A419T9W3_9FIRM|nr:TIGR01906 family membrane protein [Thermohalobacter berrensis]RKD34270.1 hypothetical protein BET03_00100 [Thermohalobacter berrensis]
MFKRSTILFIVLLIIFLPLLLLLTNVEIASFDLDYFSKKYDEYNIVEETGMDKETLMGVTKQLLKYLKGDREDIILYANVNGKREQVFERRELLHLKDVKNLYQKGYFIRRISLFISILSILYLTLFTREKLPKALIFTSIIPLGFMLVLAILLSIDFYRYFTYFHEIFFSNDLWLLNPKTDILIQMYPLQFFNSIAYRIITYFVIELVIIFIIGFVLLKIQNRELIKS